jgi:hypothetical protein
LARLVPGLLDLYLGWKGVSAQQTDERVDPDRQANLWEPVAGDHGAHGAFDERAKASSAMTWWSMHRPTLRAVPQLATRFVHRAAKHNEFSE